MEAVDTDQPAPTEASPVKPTAWGEGDASEGTARESPGIKEEQAEGNETQEASPTEHPGVVVTEMEETTVSGMLPSGSEEEGAPPVKEPGEPQGRAREEDFQEEVEVEGKERLFVTYIILQAECCFLLCRSVWYLEEHDDNLFQ